MAGPNGNARSVLLTVLGDVVLPSGRQAWLGAITDLMELLGVSPATTRQALRRLASQGLVEADRVGRLASYRVPDTALGRLEEAADRIYRRRPPAWDGRWRLLTSTFEEQNRSARDALRRELGWLGYGSLGTSSYACPWDHGDRLRAVLDKHGVHGSVDTFTATHDGDDRELAARVYDLTALAGLHAAFVARFDTGGVTQSPSPDGTATPGEDPLATRVMLVHEWRRTLFLDPGLPIELTPADWRGDEAVAVFAARYAALEAPGWQRWRELCAQHDPDGVPPPTPTTTALST